MAPMVVVGAGECGTRAAFALREAGWCGDIVLICEEAGLPYERPPLSKPGADGVVRRGICDAAGLEAARISYQPAEAVVSLDRDRRRLVLRSGLEQPYEKLLLATGARPRTLACPGGETALPFRTHADAIRLFDGNATARHAVLVGAGLIGMELAATLRQSGMAVTVVEAGERALGRGVPAALAEKLLDRHRAQGVAFRFQTGIERIDGDEILLTDGTRLMADVILAAIGVVPETRLAAQAGLAVDNGILVDERLVTTDPDVFAGGDCARFPCQRTGQAMRLESWQNARAQAEHAARAMLGAGEAFDATPWFWSDQYDLGLRIAGWPCPQRPMLLREAGADSTLWFQLDDGDRLLSVCGLGPGNSVARDVKVAQMLIARGPALPAASLRNPAIPLKALLRG